MPGPLARVIISVALSFGVGATTVLALAVATLIPALAQTAPIASQDSNFADVAVEVTQCKREEGVLTVRLRFHNTGSKPIVIRLVNKRDYDVYYVTAGNKKYFVLRDSEKMPLATATDGGQIEPSVPANGSYTFWAKFPAPPNDVKKISLFTPVAAPFDNLPITD